MNTSTRFNFFARVLEKTKTPWKASFYFFSPQKFAWLFILKEARPSSGRRMIKLLTFILVPVTTTFSLNS